MRCTMPRSRGYGGPRHDRERKDPQEDSRHLRHRRGRVELHPGWIPRPRVLLRPRHGDPNTRRHARQHREVPFREPFAKRVPQGREGNALQDRLRRRRRARHDKGPDDKVAPRSRIQHEPRDGAGLHPAPSGDKRGRACGVPGIRADPRRAAQGAAQLAGDMEVQGRDALPGRTHDCAQDRPDLDADLALRNTAPSVRLQQRHGPRLRLARRMSCARRDRREDTEAEAAEARLQ